jgi:hypothetical protein
MTENFIGYTGYVVLLGYVVKCRTLRWTEYMDRMGMLRMFVEFWQRVLGRD